MSNSHARGAARGQFAIGEHRVVRVLVGEGDRQHEEERFEYDARCADCGSLRGVVQFRHLQINHDPADCGLICGICSTSRERELSEAAAAITNEEG